jgi:hypothetical protein
VRNARKTPEVTIKIGSNVFVATARQITNKTEDALARRLLSERYAGDPWAENAHSLAEWARTALPVAFDLL